MRKSLTALAMVTTVLSTKGGSNPPNLVQLECSLHKLAYEFGVSKVRRQSCLTAKYFSMHVRKFLLFEYLVLQDF